MNKRCSQLLVAASLLALPAFGQDAEDPMFARGIPVLELNEIRITNYTPKHVRPKELFHAAENMVGRGILVKERGSAGRPVSDLSLLGNAIVIYDTAEYGAKVMETLVAMDVPQEGSSEHKRSSLVMTEYTPTSVSTNSLRSALSTFDVQDCDVLDNRTLAIRVREDRLAEMQAYLARLDVPDPQVNITCYLLTGGVGAAGDETSAGFTPSAELLTNLKSMLPDLEFRTRGFSMVQSAVAPGREVGISIDSRGLGRFDLEFTPIAYDAETGNMSVSNCQVVRRFEVVRVDGATKTDSEQLLRTDTIFRGDEYTVLGASGVNPVFVVVHLQRAR